MSWLRIVARGKPNLYVKFFHDFIIYQATSSYKHNEHIYFLFLTITNNIWYVGYSNIWLLYIVAACSKIMHFISRILNALQILCARIVWRHHIELPTKSDNIILFILKTLGCNRTSSLLVWRIKEVVCFFHFFCCIYISPYFFLDNLFFPFHFHHCFFNFIPQHLLVFEFVL
jgi:hypothetical protein